MKPGKTSSSSFASDAARSSSPVARRTPTSRMARSGAKRELPPGRLLRELGVRALQVVAGAVVVAQRHVLGADVEEGERVARVAGELALQQLEVAAVLVALLDAGLEVAVVADAQVAEREALGEVDRHLRAQLLVDRAGEAVGRAVAQQAQREVRRRGADLVLAGEVRLRQPERLAPGLAGQLVQALGVALLEALVGVEPQDPVARGGVEAGVAGRRRSRRSTARAARWRRTTRRSRRCGRWSRCRRRSARRRRRGRWRGSPAASPPRRARSCRTRCGRARAAWRCAWRRCAGGPRRPSGGRGRRAAAAG